MDHRAATRRNATIFSASVATIGLLMLYPTSTNNVGSHRRPGQSLAPVGIVSIQTPGSTTNASRIYNGPAAGTRYGPVQVQITVTHGRVTNAVAIDFPRSSDVDQQINA